MILNILCEKGKVSVSSLSKDLNYSEDGRITDDSEEQTAVRLSAMKNAKKSIMFFDSTKKNITYAFTVCHKDDIYKMITTPD